jgi:signal transduction histidine kinase
MRKLTTKAKVAYKFSLYATLIIIILGGTFFALSYYALSREMENSLENEVNELSKDYIGYDGIRIIYRQVSGEKTLDEHLRDDNMSAIIYNNYLDRIGIFGIYESEFNQQHDETAFAQFTFPEAYQRVLNSGKSEFADTNLADGRSYKALIHAIVRDGKTLGVIQVARDARTMKNLFSTDMMLLAILLPGGIISSWVLGYYLSENAFAPLDSILESTKEINTNYLSNRIEISGSENDEIVQLARSFNAMLDRLEEGVAKQKRFIENASHEFKTPLAQAILSLDLIARQLKTNDKSQLKSELEQVKLDLFELNKILEGLLMIAKLSNQSEIHAVQFKLKPELEKIITKFSNASESKKITITLIENKEHTILFPREYFQIIIANLIDNAIKYNKSEGEVTVRVEEYNYGLKISVEDTGIGLTDSELKKMSERFYRGSESITKVKGYGLGMSIVKEICDILDLELVITSQKGKGTTVTIGRIPLS